MRKETKGKANGAFDPCDIPVKCGGSDEAIKIDKNEFVTGNMKAGSIGLDIQLSHGIAQVNEGKFGVALSIFDQIFSEKSSYAEALIGRGTAYAFKGELEAAIDDFSKAIKFNPSAGEALKRQGQVCAALGELEEAIGDLTKALEFEPHSPDILHERGIASFKFKDYHAAVEDLSVCAKCDGKNKYAYTYWGMDPSCTLLSGSGKSEKALNCLDKVLLVDGRLAKAYYLLRAAVSWDGATQLPSTSVSSGLPQHAFAIAAAPSSVFSFKEPQASGILHCSSSQQRTTTAHLLHSINNRPSFSNLPSTPASISLLSTAVPCSSSGFLPLRPSSIASPSSQQRWKKQGEKNLLLQFRDQSIDGDTAFSFLETFEDTSRAGIVSGKDNIIDRSIQDAYIDAICRAKNFIYIENQYFLGSCFGWKSDIKPEEIRALHLIPKVLSLRIVNKIEAGERFTVYVVVPMWLEGVPESASIQAILDWQRRTMERMSTDVMEALQAKGIVENPKDCLTFFCLRNLEVQKSREYTHEEHPELDTDYYKCIAC